MSWHYHFIPLLAKIINAQSYLELGIYDGKNINEISQFVPRCVGVDIEFNDFSKEKFEFFNMTTRKYFQDNYEKFDMIFIDACHNYDEVVSDFYRSLKRLNKNGFVLLHDTYPVTEEMKGDGYCSDAYKIIDMIKQNKYLMETGETITIPVFPGLTLYRRLI